MKGILSQAQSAGMPEAPMPEMPMAEDQPAANQTQVPGQEPATAEEEEWLSRGRALGQKMLAKKPVIDQILSSYKKNGIEGPAEIIATAVAEIDDAVDLPETVILPLATELSGFVLDAINRTKVMKVDEKNAQEMMALVYRSLFSAYGQTPEDAAAEIQSMEQADGNITQGA